MGQERSQDYWDLIDVHISGIDRVGELLERNRMEEARDHLISCARAVWQHRWRSVRRYTLRRLGEALDTERYPQLAEVQAALMAEAPGAARRLLRYLRERKTPDVSSFVQSPKAPDPAFSAEKANSFRLWQAYAATKDPALKERLERRIDAFLDPVTVISWHETNRPWGQLVMSALHHGGIDDETLCKLILFGLDHAEQCNATSHLSEPPQTSVGGNHLFNWIMAWLTATILFPEFRRSPALQASAIARLDDELSLQVMPDGSMIEGAPGYHNCCLWGASEFLRICGEQGILLPDRVLKAWERMIWFAVGLMRPDGRAPMFGDSQDDQTAGYVSQMRRFYAIPELDWAGSRGEEGRPPAFTSKAFPCIGYSVQRTGWLPDDLWLCFDGGRFGQSHHHEDKLNFELYAHGRVFIVDAGVHSYSDHWLRRWAVTSQAHNVILVDGAGQCRWREDRDRWYSAVPLKDRWLTGPEWDLAESDFAGPYERQIGPIVQKRRVIFHRTEPRFWWITDIVEGSGKHEVAELFHFACGVEVGRATEGGVRTLTPGGPNLAILYVGDGRGASPASREVRVELYRGVEDPPRGWVSPKLYEVTPAWEAEFAGSCAMPARRDFVLLPWRGDIPDDLGATLDLQRTLPRLSLRADGKTSHVELPER